MDGGEMTRKATAKHWQDIMKNRSNIRMHNLIERLGLRATWSTNRRGKAQFQSSLVRELVDNMGEILTAVPKETDDYLNFLAKEDSFENEVDTLLQKHGATIWGRMSDREHLLSAGEEGLEAEVYPRDLYFENEEDRKQIRVLLHWWLGLKGCNVILARERLERGKRKKEETRRLQAELESSGEAVVATFDTLAPATLAALAPYMSGPDLLHGSPSCTSAMVTPQESSESPTAANRDGGPAQSVVEGVWNKIASEARESRAASISSQAGAGPRPAMGHATPQSVMRQLSEDTNMLAAKFTITQTAHKDRPPNGVSVYPLDPDTIRRLRIVLYREDNSPPLEEEAMHKEEALLCRLELAWRCGVRNDRARIERNPHQFVAWERAFFIWIELKRHLADLNRADIRWRGEGTTRPEIEERIRQHKLLMGASRELIRNFSDINGGASKLSADEVLRQALIVLVGEKCAMEMEWRRVDMAGEMDWLTEALEQFRKDEQQQGEALYYVSGLGHC
ncbi:hypothetical protein BDV95DRAFT_492517 [Massariosphaeria phaeospora]|uniref:Uncharacterized protein n=1 Tax=Massariosphaeria phaeospora TaxID=100035 RepID=A0A7C8MFD2_9PLEO|nr:hypothetical protein BDV95DRAFT_492517 [Massariosphaeria phaeospora]